LERSRQICSSRAALVSPTTLAGKSSAARHVVPFEPECRPRDGYDDAYTDGKEHSTKHVLESVPGMLRARWTRAKDLFERSPSMRQIRRTGLGVVVWQVFSLYLLRELIGYFALADERDIKPWLRAS
jgi:hypothetical protein